MISSRQTKRDSLLFVYGTLRPFADIPMARWLERVATYAGEARTRGRLYDLGSYPGLIDATVSARLGDRRALSSAVAYRESCACSTDTKGPADAERERFARVQRVVEFVDDRRGVQRARVAWLYCYRRSTLLCSRIECGDYRALRRESPNGDVADYSQTTQQNLRPQNGPPRAT